MLVYNIFKQSSQSVSLVQHSGNYKLVSVITNPVPVCTTLFCPVQCLSVQLWCGCLIKISARPALHWL